MENDGFWHAVMVSDTLTAYESAKLISWLASRHYFNESEIPSQEIRVIFSEITAAAVRAVDHLERTA